MTDPTDPSGARRRPGREPRVGDSRAPVTTAVVLVLAGVAVIAGLLILRSVTEEAGEPGAIGGPPATAVTATTAVATTPPTTEPPPSTTTTTATTTTTTPPVARTAAVVVVANASGLDGSATAMTEELAAAGYVTAPVANAPGQRLAQSIVYHVADDPAALGVARLLAEQIPTAQVLPMPDPPPLDRPLSRATVALLLGTDAAGRSLAELRTG